MQSVRWSEISAEWRGWWKRLSWPRRVLPLVFILAYWGVIFKLGGLRSDHIAGCLAVLVLYYSGPRCRPVFDFLLPLLLMGMVYDSMRYYADLIRGPIHVKEPYLFDKYFFGIPTGDDGTVLTPNEWWQKHTHPILDFFTGAAYLLFVPIFVSIAAYFRFNLSRKGTTKYTSWGISMLSPQIMWAFFWVNMIGFSTYYWYAASPPWYVAQYGFGPARIDIPASQAGCVRFDQLLGTHFFTEMYGRSADVHGAIPSLHIAYPLQAVYYAFKFGSLRIFCVGFYLLMCFSAVYLNHHYLLDIIWGSTYAIATCWLVDMFYERRLKKNANTLWKPSMPGGVR